MATQKARVGRIYLKGTLFSTPLKTGYKPPMRGINTLKTSRSNRNSPYAGTDYQNLNMAPTIGPFIVKSSSKEKLSSNPQCI